MWFLLSPNECFRCSQATPSVVTVVDAVCGTVSSVIYVQDRSKMFNIFQDISTLFGARCIRLY